MPGTVLSARDTLVNKIKAFPFEGPGWEKVEGGRKTIKKINITHKEIAYSIGRCYEKMTAEWKGSGVLRGQFILLNRMVK